jgi:ATP phosphoribosyltransferase regulatory subunit
MQVMQPRISGTRDYIGADAIALRAAREAIEAALRSYAYASIDPPILERPSPFLDRSGEDIRRRMYIFSDPGGREVCLRPELTIPACRAYLRQLQAPEDEAHMSPEREARLCYVGPAFRYESTNEGRYRQFYQAGAELIGAKWREAADAEILAVALDALEAAGLKDILIEIGDLGILYAFVDHLPIGERSKTRLLRLALRNRKEERFISAISAKQAADSDETTEFGELALLLASADPGKAELLMREVLALADVRHVGGRAPAEIVERLASRAAQQSAEPISAELMQGVLELLSIRADPATAFDAVREHFRKFGVGSVDPVLEQCENRMRLFGAYRKNGAEIEFNVGLRRGLEYYTGFVFEIFAQGLTQIGHLCGGGRYDNLLEALGANLSIPAVGFAIGLDRLLIALQKSQADGSGVSRAPPRALVVAAGAVRHEESIRISVALRNAGWSVETETSGRRARSVLSYALKRQIPYVVFVGEDELKNGQVRIKRLDDRNDQLVALSSLDAYVKDEGVREAAGRKT